MKKFIFLISLLLIVSACSSDSSLKKKQLKLQKLQLLAVHQNLLKNLRQLKKQPDFSVETILAKSYEGDACAVFEEVERDYFIVYGYADMTNAPKVLDYETFDEWVNAYQNFQSDDPEFENVLTMVNKLLKLKKKQKLIIVQE